MSGTQIRGTGVGFCDLGRFSAFLVSQVDN